MLPVGAFGFGLGPSPSDRGLELWLDNSSSIIRGVGPSCNSISFNCARGVGGGGGPFGARGVGGDGFNKALLPGGGGGPFGGRGGCSVSPFGGSSDSGSGGSCTCSGSSCPFGTCDGGSSWLELWLDNPSSPHALSCCSSRGVCGVRAGGLNEVLPGGVGGGLFGGRGGGGGSGGSGGDDVFFGWSALRGVARSSTICSIDSCDNASLFFAASSLSSNSFILSLHSCILLSFSISVIFLPISSIIFFTASDSRLGFGL